MAMEKNILIINIGSSSKKYHLYSGENLLIDAHFEHDKEGFVVTYAGEKIKEIIPEIYENGLSHFCEVAKKSGFISDTNPIFSVGLRLVAPGEYFTKDHIINEEFISKLLVVAKSDPTHIDPIQTELSIISKLFPNIKVVAVSDSAFHSTMPQVARVYAIPEKLANEKDLYRFGFHGISIASLVHKFKEHPSGIENRVIVCHLGSGASVTALLGGKSADTSMGYSPLEGIVMSSRVGNIDAGAVLHLTEKHSVNDLQKLFYSQSGLLALSGLSGDMRVLLDAEKDGHAGAHLAIESFVYSIRKYIGAYAGVLNGVDAIVFSGTIGERSAVLRDRICKGFEYLKIEIDPEKNKNMINDLDISKDGGAHVYVMHGDEPGELLRRTLVAVKE
jgi:acetate kinase